MRLKRKQLRRLIESIINEQEDVFPTDAMTFAAATDQTTRDRLDMKDRKEIALRNFARHDFDKLLEDFAEKLKEATLGFGGGKPGASDPVNKTAMKMIAKGFEYSTGMGTDEDAIKEVFRDIVEFVKTDKALAGNDFSKSVYKVYNDPIGMLSLIAMEFEDLVGEKLTAVLEDDLSSSERQELHGIIPGYENMLLNRNL